MASHAEIANDLAAQASFWTRRDDDVARLCRDSARLIRALLDGQAVDGRTYAGVHARLLSRIDRYRGRTETAIARSLARGLVAMTELRAVTS